MVAYSIRLFLALLCRSEGSESSLSGEDPEEEDDSEEGGDDEISSVDDEEEDEGKRRFVGFFAFLLCSTWLIIAF